MVGSDGEPLESTIILGLYSSSSSSPFSCATRLVEPDPLGRLEPGANVFVPSLRSWDPELDPAIDPNASLLPLSYPLLSASLTNLSTPPNFPLISLSASSNPFLSSSFPLISFSLSDNSLRTKDNSHLNRVFSSFNPLAVVWRATLRWISPFSNDSMRASREATYSVFRSRKALWASLEPEEEEETAGVGF